MVSNVMTPFGVMRMHMKLNGLLAALTAPLVTMDVTSLNAGDDEAVMNVSADEMAWEDCVTFLYQDGKFDFVPINP